MCEPTGKKRKRIKHNMNTKTVVMCIIIIMPIISFIFRKRPSTQAPCAGIERVFTVLQRDFAPKAVPVAFSSSSRSLRKY